nr:MAG TPA: hypothetical protein [Caudoviricetes sp.]
MSLVELSSFLDSSFNFFFLVVLLVTFFSCLTSSHNSS